MDGPYAFDVKVVAHNEWALNFVERTADNKCILLRATLDASAVLSQIRTAAHAVVNLCRKREWVDDDLIRLEELLKS